MMIKAILVDDEILAIKMLQKLINWDRFNINIIATASDGEEAFEAFKSFSPDLIIADIGMPQMDGLEFLQKVREINHNTEFILISAHADFKYVQQAMRLGCVDYVLKPIDEMELEKTIEKAVERIHNRTRLATLKEQEAAQKEKSILLDYMKTGRESSAVKTFLNGNKYDGCRLMSIEVTSESARQYETLGRRISNQKNYFDRTLRDILMEYGECVLFDLEEESWLTILKEPDSKRVAICAKRIINFFKKDLDFLVKICFSEASENLSSLPFLYNKLVFLRKYSMYRQDSEIIGYGYNCEENEYTELEFSSLESNMAAAIRRYDGEKALALLDEMLEWSRHINLGLLNYVYEFCYNTILFARERFFAHMDGALLPGSLRITYAELSSIISQDKLREIVAAAIMTITSNVPKKISNATSSDFSDIVQKGITFLKEKYATNITLSSICKELAISKNYFCYLFKKETGRTIWEYLTDIRMEHAKILLKETDLKSFEIASKVGYDNTSYFSKTFKRLYKMTPNEYR